MITSASIRAIAYEFGKIQICCRDIGILSANQFDYILIGFGQRAVWSCAPITSQVISPEGGPPKKKCPVTFDFKYVPGAKKLLLIFQFYSPVIHGSYVLHWTIVDLIDQIDGIHQHRGYIQTVAKG